MALGAASCAVQSGAVEAPEHADGDRLFEAVHRKAAVGVRSEGARARLRGAGRARAGQRRQHGDAVFQRGRTHQTSLGLFVTDDTYVGKNGYSLRLDGLDRGVNDRARERAIVMHGAPYVSEAVRQGERPARPQLGMPGDQRDGRASR